MNIIPDMTTTPATHQRVAGTQQSTGSQPSVVDANRDTADVLRNLAGSAYNIRRYALRMGAVQGQGYIGQALGIADVLAVAYCHALDFHADDPEWEGRDRCLLSSRKSTRLNSIH